MLSILCTQIYIVEFFPFYFRFREMQSKAESRTSDVRNELKVKAFEAERSQMVYEETVKKLRDSELEVEKLQKKAEVSE